MHHNCLRLSDLHFPVALPDRTDVRISDFRIVAGLLFPRFNDPIERFAVFRQDSGTSTVYLVKDTEERTFYALSVAVLTLVKCGYAKVYVGNPSPVRLKNAGMRMVVNEWFHKSASVHDRLAVARDFVE